jgi:hypothetical protein
MTRICIVVGFITLLGFSPVSTAIQAQQDVTAIKYGQTVRDRITAATFEFRYTFEGKEKEVIIIRMESDGATDALKTPAFKLLNGASQLVDSTKIFTLSLAFAYAAFQLPKDGEYTVVATRRDGKAGKDVGRFVFSLNNAAPLEADKPASDEANDKIEKYYAIEPGGPFVLSYTRTGGPFVPSISISALMRNGATDQVAEMSGRLLDSGTLSLKPDKGVNYLVRVGKAFLSNSTGAVRYTLKFSAQIP